MSSQISGVRYAGIPKPAGQNIKLQEYCRRILQKAVSPLHRFFRHIISSQLGDDRYLEGEQSLGAEDFAYYTQKIPGLLFRVGTTHSHETSYPLHHSCFDVDERVIAPTSALMAYMLIRHLQEKVLHIRHDLSSAEPLLSEQ